MFESYSPILGVWLFSKITIIILAFILIIFLKLISWIPIIGRYVEVNHIEQQESIKNIFYQQQQQQKKTRYELELKFEKRIIKCPI